ncbi:MAG: glycosyltransferase, partial [Thermodesulfobacteriota bacterium]
MHLAVDLSEANAFTWVCVELVMALCQLGERVTIPHCRLHPSIEPRQAKILRPLMGMPNKKFQVKWSHYWPKYLKQTLNGEVNAEIFSTNYRYRQEGRILDLWMRHVQVNGYRKLPVSSFTKEGLLEIGISDSDCAIVPHGYSPEIDLLYPHGRQPRDLASSDLHLFVVTNSHDLYRYGTDILIQALGKAFNSNDPVVVHIKDYGSVHGKNQLLEWINAQSQFPRLTWHREFLTKNELTSLYADMDILIAPFRGEGFAMKILDAMALGLPVLMPAFGGPTEFIKEGTFLPLPFNEVNVGESLDRRYYYIGEGAYWCEVQLENLIENLRSLPERKEELLNVGRAARAYVQGRYTWKRAAEKLMLAMRSWEQERTGRVSIRRGPDALPLSVIIPTRDREEILGQALQGYQRQSLPAEQFEIVLVNDHGPQEKLKSLLQANPVSFPVRVLENKGPEGPAAARNLGIEQARGEIVLITGDDIIPDTHFLREHLEGHKRFPQLESALVGKTLWHPDLEITPFMEIITGKGGEQFDYGGAKHNRKVSFGHFYTSNVSLKRAFLIEEEDLFSTHYRYAAYEDIELAYRLHLNGMVLRFIKTAKGYHHHAMSLRSFVERQRRVGRMLTLLAIQRPSFVPDQHTTFLRALEFGRSSDNQYGIRENKADPMEKLIQTLTTCYEFSLEYGDRLKTPQGRDIVDGDGSQWRHWLSQGGLTTWKAINELILRCGMAEEWAVNETEAEWAKNWLLLLTLPQYLGP